MKGSRIHPSRISTLLLTAAALLCASVVIAPPAPFGNAAFAQSDADLEKARDKFLTGKNAYQERRYDEAAAAFLEAYELSGRSKLLNNLGHAYWKANKLRKAEKYLQQYLNEHPDADNADQVVEAIIQIQEEMAAQMTSVEVTASRAGVDVYVSEDAEPRCQTPCSISLLPGEHTLTARPQGSQPIAKTVNVSAEGPASVRFELPGRLQISTDQRSGTVRIAGAGSYGLPLGEPIELSAGKHEVTVIGDDARWSGEIEVVGGETTSILVPLGAAADAGSDSTLRTVSYGLFGVSAGLLVGGIIMGMQASDTHAALESQQSANGRVSTQMVEQGRGEQGGANVMYALSAVSLASGAGLFAWDLYGGGSSDEDEIPASTEPADEGDAGEDLLELGDGAAHEPDEGEAPTGSEASRAGDEAPEADEDDGEVELF